MLEGPEIPSGPIVLLSIRGLVLEGVEDGLIV